MIEGLAADVPGRAHKGFSHDEKRGWVDRIVFCGREPDARLDRLVITDDLWYVPYGE